MNIGDFDNSSSLTPDPELGALDAADDAQEAAEQREDAEFDAALKAVISSGLIAGPDASVVSDVQHDVLPKDPTEELAANVELDAQVDAIYQTIVSRAPEHKVQPSLQRVTDCLDFMGNPQRAYRSIHITGTNGKTSTARMIEALVRERGLRTGRFTSPHLTTVRERISIDGLAISRQDFIDTWNDVEPFIEIVDAKSAQTGGPRMSFFEVFTVMAYQAFANAPIDVAIVEVGMGGTWDATNVIDADVAVIGPVALDHERWLGSTVEEIAEEKLGIVKPSSTLVSAAQTETVAALVVEKSQAMHAPLIMAGYNLEVVSRETAVSGQMVTIRTPGATYEDIPVALKGYYQADNAALAIAAVEAFFGGVALSGEVVEHALMSVSAPGRMEVVRSSPVVVVDAAHNPHGAQATVEALKEYYPGRLVAVVAMMADKDVEGFLGVLEPAFDEIVITGMPTERAMDAEELAEIAEDVFGDERVHVETDIAAAIDTAASLAESDSSQPMTYPAVVVLGSIQLVASVRTLMGRPGPDGA